MGEQIHPQQGHQIRQRPAELGSQLQEPQDQHGDQCGPNLDLDGIGAGPHKGLDLEVLLQRLEEDLDLPSVLIDGRNRAGPQLQVVGEKDEDLPGIRIIDLDPSQEIGASLEGPGPVSWMSWSLRTWRCCGTFLSSTTSYGIVLHPGDEIDPLTRPTTKQRVVVIRPVIDHDGAGSEGKGRHHLHIGHLPLGDDGKLGKVSIMVQEQMQFDGPLGPAETGPVKHRSDRDRWWWQSRLTSLFLNRNFFLPVTLHPATLAAAGGRPFHKAARDDARWHRPGWSDWGRGCPDA